jgi:hypothetical protein
MLLTYNLPYYTGGPKKDTVHLLKANFFQVAKIILVAIIAKKETNFEYSKVQQFLHNLKVI